MYACVPQHAYECVYACVCACVFLDVLPSSFSVKHSFSCSCLSSHCEWLLPFDVIEHHTLHNQDRGGEAGCGDKMKLLLWPLKATHVWLSTSWMFSDDYMLNIFFFKKKIKIIFALEPSPDLYSCIFISVRIYPLRLQNATVRGWVHSQGRGLEVGGWGWGVLPKVILSSVWPCYGHDFTPHKCNYVSQMRSKVLSLHLVLTRNDWYLASQEAFYW